MNRSGEIRLLQIHNHYRLQGGEDRVVDAQRKLLEEKGHQVRRFELANPVRVTATAAQMALSPWNPFSFRKLTAAVQDWRPDIGHVHNTWFSASPSVISALARQMVPSIMTLHNYRLTCVNAQLLRDGAPCELCVGSTPWQGVRYRCYRDSVVASAFAASTLAFNRRLHTYENGVSRFLVFTEFQRRLMIRAGLEPDRLKVVPNFVPDPGPRPAPPGESDTLLYVGRLSTEKGIDQLVDAWMRTPVAGLRLVVLGDGPLAPSLSARANSSIEFRGRASAEEVTKIMLGARALLYPSICYEGQPLVLLEALASGLPIVAPDHGGIGETTGGAGMTVGPSGWEGALAAIAGTGPDDLNAMSQASRNNYLEKHTRETALEMLESVYLSVLSEA